MADMTDEEWGLWKTAVAEYSMYRPYLQSEAFVPVADSIQQVPAEGAYGIESIDYGEQVTLTEVMTAAEGEQGWCFENGMLHLTPAPADTTPINVVWRILHQGDELTRTFPTVPATDMHIVQWLVEAVIAEAEATPVELGLAGYTIGGTSVKWAQQGGSSGPSVATRSERLRSRAIAALGSPLAEWG
jgi:hypothetical protein